jgi:hypothetical protein
MSRLPQLYQWTQLISTHLPALRGPQAEVLAAWSFATVTVGTCGRSTVAAFLAELLDKKPAAVRQQLREWYCEPAAKRGPHRQALPVMTCFGALLQWVLAWWPAEERQLAVALDATRLGNRFTVLAVCVVYRACAIPIAWTVLPATAPGGWKKHWLALLHLVDQQVPCTWTVIALADRGLYAPWLYHALKAMHWHPFLRLNTQGHYRPLGARVWRSLAKAAPKPGTAWTGTVRCFKSRSVEATLLARWEAGYTDPWLILTDLTPEQANVSWYAWRAWIECSFKTAKRGAWQWQATHMTDPQRAAGLWLVLAVATLWSVSVGGEADATRPASSFDQLPPRHVARRSGPQLHRPRELSVVHQGRLRMLAQLVKGQDLAFAHFHPEPWPPPTIGPPATR